MRVTGEESRIAILVHEVRSPVAALTAIAASARETSRVGRAELVRLCLDACASIERLVRDVTVTSVRVAHVDVGALVRDAVHTRELAGVAVKVEAPHALPPVVGDAVRLRQAVDNLLENAVVHAAGSGPVSVTVRATATAVTVAVADGGPGIPPGDLARIFDPGVRLDPGRRGAGLGLAIAKAIIEAHGGSLTVDSSPGRGATFTINLPRRDDGGGHPET